MKITLTKVVIDTVMTIIHTVLGMMVFICLDLPEVPLTFILGTCWILITIIGCVYSLIEQHAYLNGLKYVEF